MHSSSPTLSALTPPCLLYRLAHSGVKTGNCHFKSRPPPPFFLHRLRIIGSDNQSKLALWKLQPMKSDGRWGLRIPAQTQWLSTDERVRDDAWCWFKETGCSIGKVCAPQPPTPHHKPSPWKTVAQCVTVKTQLDGKSGLLAAIFRESHTYAVPNPAWLSFTLSDLDLPDWQPHRPALWVSLIS